MVPRRPRPLNTRRRCAIAQAETRTAMPHGAFPRRTGGTKPRLQLAAQVVGAGAFARDVIAYSNRQRRLLVQREPVVEARDPIRFRRRYVQAPARVLEAAAADPADLVLQPMEYGQQ